MKKFCVKLLALVTVMGGIFLTCSPYSLADVIGKISATEGRVDLLKSGGDTASEVRVGDCVSSGDILRTKSGSKAEIAFTDTSVVRLSENTRLEITDYGFGPGGKRADAALFLDRGKIRAILSRSAEGSFVINTPNAAGAVKGTDIVAIYQRSSTSIAALNGKVLVSGMSPSGKPVELTSGQTSVISGETAPSAPRILLSMEIKAHESDTGISKGSMAAEKSSDDKMTAEGYSAPDGMKAVVTKTAGGVRIKNRGSITWHDARENEVLAAGDSVETKDNGKIEIRLENGNVITLQQNSSLIIQKLSSDSKTGNYENLLESGGGKLRAQVQKIKGNSKFEVKTPNAVACVRGTIMYLNILPGLTNSYFEEGNGTLRNLISGTVKDVPIGTGAAADGNGNISDPVPPSDDQKSQWHQGWDVGGEAEGYSAPSGDLGQGGDSDNNSGDTGFQNVVFDEKPVTDIIGTTESGGGPGGSEGEGGITNPYITGTSSGSFGFVEPDEYNNFDAVLSSNTVLSSPWAGQLDLHVSGEFMSPGYRIFEGNITAASVDGGTSFGWVGGIMHSWEGILSSIYIDPSGRAGNLFGYLSGTNTVETGTGSYYGDFSGSGDIFVIQMAQLEAGIEYPVEYGEGYGDLRLAFNNGNGLFYADFDRQLARIEGQDWGIWRDAYRGSYYNPDNLNEWIGNAGGRYGEKGYFFATVEGIDDLEGGVRMDMTGAYLDMYTLGAYYGSILAGYGEGTEGIGLGGYTEEALTSSAIHGNYSYSGQLSGILGTTGSLWSGSPFYLTSIGNLEDEYDGEFDNFIWYTDFISTDNDNERYTAYSAEEGIGSYYGTTSGVGKDNTMKGFSRFIYIDPSGYAGVFKGSVDGAYSQAIGMYIFDGKAARDTSVDPVFVSLSPEALNYSIWLNSGEGNLEGYYSDGGRVYGYDNLYSASIADFGNGTAQNWGIYNQRIIGQSYMELADDFSAKMGGKDSFGCYNPTIMHYNTYNSGDGASYSCEYSENNRYGYSYRYEPGPDTYKYTYTYYYADGTTYTNTCIYDSGWNYLSGDGVYDTWDTSSSLADLLSAAPEGYSLSSESSYSYAENDYGFWIADVNASGSDWFDGTLNGAFITYTKMGLMQGDLTGSYTDDTGGWIAAGSGTWNGNRLTMSGMWGEDTSSLYENSYGYPSLAGEEYGLLGSTVEEWWNKTSFPVLAMGRYYSYGTDDQPIIWITPFNSYNAEMDNHTSLDGSAFYGLTAGIWKDGLMSDAKAVAIYAAPDGSMGIIKGNLGGEYYPGLDMWMATGSLSALQKSGESIDPASLYESITTSDMPYLYAGGSIDGAVVYGESSDGYLYSVDEGQWGIFDFKTGGNYNDEWVESKEKGLAFGFTDGLYGPSMLLTSTDASVGDGTIAGTLSGSCIDLLEGTISKLNGDIRGIYDSDNNTWIAAAIGEWEKKLLAYSGVVMEGGFGYFYGENEGPYLDDGGLDAIMGGSDDLFDGSAEISIVGNAWNPDYNEDWTGDDKLWAGDFFITTDDNAAATGTIGGTSLNNSFKGALLGLYIRQTQDGYKAGYITSSDAFGNRDFLSGNFYPSLSMFSAEGSLTAFMDTPTEFTPEDILFGNESALLSDDFYDPIVGDLNGDLYGEDLQIADQQWGVWRAGCGGWLDSVPAGNWNSYIAESFEDQYGEYSFPYYSLIYIDGTTTADNGLEAVIHGYDLGMTYLSEASGLMAGDYDTGEMRWEGLSLGTWVEKELTLSGLASGGIRAAGDWDNWFDPGDSYEDFSGEFSGIIGSTQTGWQDGSFKAVAMGDYAINESANSYLLNAEMGSFNAREISPVTLDGEGAFYGFAHAAVGDSADGRLTDTASGLRLAAIYIASNGTGGYNAGVLRGGLDMDLVEIPYDGEVGMWIAEGYLTPYAMETDIGISPEELPDYISWDWEVLGASGVGSFSNGGAIQADYFTGDTMSIEGYDQWGIMQAALTGQTSSVVDSDWRLALGGASYTDDSHEIADGYFLISAGGDSWSNNVFDGTFRGVYLSEIDENTFNVGKIEGDVVGNYQQVEGVDTVFQAQMLGEWVDLAELSTDVLGFNNDALAEMVQIPVTETYTALLQGAGGFGPAGDIGAITSNMDISFYAQQATDLSGIWAALINGNYSGYTGSDNWSVNYSNNGVNATLTGTQWNDGQWLANVSGNNGNSTFTGQAGGTYTGTDSGTFDGAGAGTWNTPTP